MAFRVAIVDMTVTMAMAPRTSIGMIRTPYLYHSPRMDGPYIWHWLWMNLEASGYGYNINIPLPPVQGMRVF